MFDHSPSVVLGEAPESDEDDLYLNEDPETPPSPSPEYAHNANDDESDRKSVDPYRDSILHRKLREKNQVFREELVMMASQPYLNATKEIDTLTQQLVKSQKMVLNVSCGLRKIARDLMQVENTLDALNVNRKHIPKFNDTNDIQSPESISSESSVKERLTVASNSSHGTSTTIM